MKRLLLCFSLLFTAVGQADVVQLPHDGLTLNANLVQAEGNWPKGPAVLLTHGTLAHGGMEIISTFQDLFHENGISTLALTLSLGLDKRKGMYDCATPHTHHHTDAVDEIGLWLDWLKQQGAESVVLMGHSRGGNQTAWFASQKDDPAVKSVILVAPQTWTEKGEAKGYEKKYGKPLAAVLADAEKRVAAGKPDEMVENVDFIYCKDTSASADAIVSYYKPDQRMDTPSLLAKIGKPVLVFAGSDDRSVKGLVDKVQPQVQDGKVQLEIIDGADHFFRDLYSEELVEMAIEFIAEAE